MKSLPQFLKVFLIFFISSSMYCQKEKTIKGLVTTFENEMSNVSVTNLNSKKTTFTDYKGHFEIDVKLNDTLQFRSVQYISQNIIINDFIFELNKISIQLKEKVIELDEILINSNNLSGDLEKDLKNMKLAPLITALSKGLPNADVKALTKSERLLAESDGNKWVEVVVHRDTIYDAFEGISLYISLHKAINRISGRTHRMKDRVAFDRELKIREDILKTFSEKTIAEEFDIPITRVKSFLDYCEAQPDFNELLTNRSPFDIWDFFESKSIIYKKFSD